MPECTAGVSPPLRDHPASRRLRRLIRPATIFPQMTPIRNRRGCLPAPKGMVPSTSPVDELPPYKGMALRLSGLKPRKGGRVLFQVVVESTKTLRPIGKFVYYADFRRVVPVRRSGSGAGLISRVAGELDRRCQALDDGDEGAFFTTAGQERIKNYATKLVFFGFT